MKLIGNAFILGTIELLAETMTLADKSGVGAGNVSAYLVLHDVITLILFRSSMTSSKV